MFTTPFPDYLVRKDAWTSVTTQMRKYVSQYITPISEFESHDMGHALGTGTYLELRENVYLLTNEHVARKMRSTPIAHLPREDDYYVRVNNPMQAVDWPVDVALSRLDKEVFREATRKALPTEKLARIFSPVDWELLFICGFPGFSSPRFTTNPNRRTTLFGYLNTIGQPYLTQQVELPTSSECKYDPAIHFAISYPNEGTLRVGGGFHDLPDPRGLSGSLIWDTGYVAAGGVDWTPNKAMVCGIVHTWDPDTQRLICTKIEFMRAIILHSLRKEAAYFRWLNGEDLSGDALAHWLWSEKIIQHL